MISFWIAVSTVCFSSGNRTLSMIDRSYRTYDGRELNLRVLSPQCVDMVVRKSTSPITALEGETVYEIPSKVKKKLLTEAEICAATNTHVWRHMLPESKDDIRIRQICVYCRTKRIRITDEMWEEIKP